MTARSVRKITLAATLAMDAGVTYEVGGPYRPGTAASGVVSRIVQDKGGYFVHNDHGGYEFIAAHYVDPASVEESR